jgi:enediyne biosynthesis protein E4
VFHPWACALFSVVLPGALLVGCPIDTDDDDTTSDGPCDPAAPVTPSGAFFTDISDSSGIRVDNYYDPPPPGTAINDHSRLAFADLDGDGFDDVVMHSLFPNPQGGVPFEHLVFLNQGDGTFVDHSDASGLRGVQAGFFAFGDVDNDGDQDLYAGLDLDGYEANRSAIYLNDGQGVFSVLPDAGVEDGDSVAASAVFADLDGDAVLDLFVGNGGTTYVATDLLYRGNGDGTFTDVSSQLGAVLYQPSNGSVTCDIDADGDLDILVSTYSVSTHNGHNRLWRNDGGGSFDEVAVDWGFAAQATGNYYLESTGYGQDSEPDVGPDQWVGSNGFGLDCGDVDGDGRLDVFVTAISHPVSSDYARKWSDPSQLLINDGGAFTNVWLDRGLPFNEGDVDGAMVDSDNDGRLDLSLSRDRKYEGSYLQPDQKAWFGLMWQQPDGSFVSVGVDSGINDPEEELLRMKSAQNHAWSDIDADGDLDLLVGGRDQGGGRPNFLFRNELGHQNRWLQVVVEGDGVAVNRDGIGTRLTLTDGARSQTREKKSSRGMYNSEDTRVQHFGLGDMGCELELRVRWPDGSEATFGADELGEDRRLRLVYPDQLTAP